MTFLVCHSCQATITMRRPAQCRFCPRCGNQLDPTPTSSPDHANSHLNPPPIRRRPSSCTDDATAGRHGGRLPRPQPAAATSPRAKSSDAALRSLPPTSNETLTEEVADVLPVADEGPYFEESEEAPERGAGWFLGLRPLWLARVLWASLFVIVTGALLVWSAVIYAVDPRGDSPLGVCCVGCPCCFLPVGGLIACRFLALLMTRLLVWQVCCENPECGEVLPAVGRWACPCGYHDPRERHVLSRCRGCKAYFSDTRCPQCDATILL